MRIYVLSVKKMARYSIISALILISIFVGLMMSPKVADVFKPNRELPIYSVDCMDKKVAITFDCAWGANDIPNILNTLEKENVKATFFIVGQWAEKFPDAVKSIAAGGHDVANHSYSHLRMGVIDGGRVKSEIIKCGDKLGELSGTKVDLFRPPYGDYNNGVIREAQQLGYYTIQWDVDSLDWKPGISREEILDRIMKKVKPGSIILFHNDTPHTAGILPVIIKSLKNEGYVFEPVSKMILRQDYYIDFDGKQKRRQ